MGHFFQLQSENSKGEGVDLYQPEFASQSPMNTSSATDVKFVAIDDVGCEACQ
jgi:hypothetical protein